MRLWFAVIVGGCLLLQPQPGLSQSKKAPFGGEVVGKRGRVEGNRGVSWDSVRIRQILPQSAKVRTNANAETAILLQYDKELKLDEGGLIELLEQKVALDHGRAWIRNRDSARPLDIIAPGSTVKTNGTELVIETRPNNVTVVSVLDGSVQLSNDAGSIVVPQGRTGTATPGVPPTLGLLVNPDSAVQWILYYPTSFPRHDLLQSLTTGGLAAGFDYLYQGNFDAALRVLQGLTPTSVWARIGSSMIYLEQGELDQAENVLGDPVVGELEVERLTQLAAVRLRAGRATAADTILRAALKIDPTALRAMGLRARIALTQNNKDSAQALADRLVNAHEQSVEAHLVAGEVAQAFFKLDVAMEHFNRALALDPNDVHALVNRARIRFGSGDTRRAADDLRRASALAPTAPEVSSLQGFILLAQNDTRGAREAFDRALARDPNFAEPHLGLGLLAFKQGASEEGLKEMLAATLLEPRVALYHSYLGKAFHQLNRHREALAALKVAKEDDKNDPTPWLYSALIHRDLNQQGEALRDLDSAIVLNGYRAVYRSRLLLDRDMATKNVSLAEIYGQLGFDAWAAHEGVNSLAADPTNASAHLFLADAFTNLPDRQQAQSSELLQYRLNAPVNQNSFNSFNEYTALFEQPRATFTSTGQGGLTGHRSLEQAANGGNNRVAYFGYLGVQQDSGARPFNPDRRIQGTVDLAFAPGANTTVIGSFTNADKKRGFDEDASVIVGENTGRPLVIRQVSLNRDSSDSFRDQVQDAMIGLRHSFSPATIFQSAVQASWVTSSQFTPDYAIDLSQDPNIVDLYRGTLQYRAPYALYDAGAQLIHHSRYNQTWFLGVETYRSDLQQVNAFNLRNAAGQSAAVTLADTARDHGTAVWIRHEAELFDRLHTTAGAQLKSDAGHDMLTDTVLSFRRVDPFVGLSFRLTPRWLIRTAAFQNLNSSFVGASLAPSSIAGFVIARNELPYATRREGNLAIERSGASSFQMLQVSERRTENATTGFGLSWSNAQRLDYQLNYLLGSRWAFAASNGFVRNETDRYTSFDNVAEGSLTFVHPIGLLARVTDSYVSQVFEQTNISELKNTQYNLTDAELSYEVPGKRAKITFAVTNIFNREFSTLLEGFMLELPRPQRHAVMTLQLRY